MKIQIKKRRTDEIILEGRAENIKDFLEEYKSNLRELNLRGANLSGADFWGADLSGADLWGVDLSGANLWGANLSGADLREAKIKISQKEDLVKSIGVEIED